MRTAAAIAADAGVVASARALTHLRVRSVACSAPPSPRLAMDADSRFARFGGSRFRPIGLLCPVLVPGGASLSS